MKKMTLVAAAVAVTAGAGFLAEPALGQAHKQKQEIRIDPPTPQRADKPPILWNYLVAIIIIAAAFGANLIPSKRGHQD